MDAAGTMLHAAETMERVVKVMEHCRTPEDIRSGFLKVADLMECLPGQKTLVRSMRIGAQSDGMSDDQVISLRDQLVTQFPNNARFCRQSAGRLSQELGKKWWQFWK